MSLSLILRIPEIRERKKNEERIAYLWHKYFFYKSKEKRKLVCCRNEIVIIVTVAEARARVRRILYFLISRGMKKR